MGILIFLITISLFLNSCNSRRDGHIPHDEFTSDWNYTLKSQCDGRIIEILDSDFLSDGYLDVFDECEKHRRCGCIETNDGVYWDLVEGTNTSAWQRKWWQTLAYHTWTYKNFEKEKNCGRRNC